jgi:hypothetical protein
VDNPIADLKIHEMLAFPAYPFAPAELRRQVREGRGDTPHSFDKKDSSPQALSLSDGTLHKNVQASYKG